MDSGDHEPPAPAGFIQFSGQSPDGSGMAWFLIARDALLGHFKGTGNRHKLLEGLLVKESLAKPTGTWHDLKREEMQDGLCYCAKPESRRFDTTIEIPSPPGMVFAIFIGEERGQDGQYIVQKWNWVEECKERKGFPVDHDRRFGRRLWPQE